MNLYIEMQVQWFLKGLVAGSFLPRMQPSEERQLRAMKKGKDWVVRKTVCASGEDIRCVPNCSRVSTNSGWELLFFLNMIFWFRIISHHLAWMKWIKHHWDPCARILGMSFAGVAFALRRMSQLADELTAVAPVSTKKMLTGRWSLGDKRAILGISFKSDWYGWNIFFLRFLFDQIQEISAPHEPLTNAEKCFARIWDLKFRSWSNGVGFTESFWWRCFSPFFLGRAMQMFDRWFKSSNSATQIGNGLNFHWSASSGFSVFVGDSSFRVWYCNETLKHCKLWRFLPVWTHGSRVFFLRRSCWSQWL